MAYTTLQNTPVEINLLALVNDNGWQFSGTELIHESCNSGTVVNKAIFEQNREYDININVKSLSGGYITLSFGSFTQQINTAGLSQITVLSTTANPRISLFSNANTIIDVISIKDLSETDETNSTDNIVYSFDIQKWVRYDNYYPDFGMSMFTSLYSFKDGQMYSHTDKDNKARFYNKQFQSRIKLQQVQPKVVSYQSLKIECNKLLVTTTNGVQTSLGQVSDLIEQDFEIFNLDDGVTQLSVYDYEGNYRANFLRDKPDLNFGDRLKGRYITIELTTKDDRDFNLYKVVIQYNISTPNE